MTWCLIRWLCSLMQVSLGPMTNTFFFFSWAVISCITKSFVWDYARIVPKPWTFFERFFGGHPTECSFTSTKRHVFHFSQEKPIQSTGNPKKYFKEKINKFFMPSNTLGARHSWSKRPFDSAQEKVVLGTPDSSGIYPNTFHHP